MPDGADLHPSDAPQPRAIDTLKQSAAVSVPADVADCCKDREANQDEGEREKRSEPGKQGRKCR